MGQLTYRRGVVDRGPSRVIRRRGEHIVRHNVSDRRPHDVLVC